MTITKHTKQNRPLGGDPGGETDRLRRALIQSQFTAFTIAQQGLGHAPDTLLCGEGGER